jgi:mRNA-degrading endonuclease toxin of MazEF toxin-antitoxin module
MTIQPEEGDIVYFYYNDAGKNKFAVNLEPRILHKNKDTFNAVVITSQNVDVIYPGDYRLPNGTLHKDSKVICDQIVPLPKSEIKGVAANVTQQDLEEIRKKAAKSIGIDYNNTTS